MSSFSEQLEQIKTLISSTFKSDKSCAYSTLLQLQEQSVEDGSLSQLLVQSSKTLISMMVEDARDEEEEVSALALKCLGFMVYFPPVVAKIPRDISDVVVEMLAGVIRTTKMKTVCNLAVWCISMQNLDVSVLGDHFNSLLRAVVYSLDNPCGSLSTTFEGTQAIMKLARQIEKMMKNTSSIWSPPIYRRLVSSDKKERDVCHRCLLNVQSLMCPPSAALSKAIIQDFKQKLLPGLKELLKHGKKVHALQAWRWFILFMGSHAVKHRHLVNEMLKIPEQTFSDQDPQVQNASLVAWEGLIDALTSFPSNVSATMPAEDQKKSGNASPIKQHLGEVITVKFLKSLKLIMTPLIGIISGKCDVSVQSSCFSTWCYLLHKLDAYVSYSGIVSAVVDPIFKAVFQTGPVDGNSSLWGLCIHLLEDFIQSRCSNARIDTNNQNNFNVSAQECYGGVVSSSEWPWKPYPIIWFPRDQSQLVFFLGMCNCILNQAIGNPNSIKGRSLSLDAVLRIFRSIARGVQIDIGRMSSSHDDIMQSVREIIKFVNCICEAVVSEDNLNADLLTLCLHILGVIVEELDPSLLVSPLCSIPLNISCLNKLQSVGEINTKLPIMSIDYVHRQDTAPPVIYLTTMYFSLIVHAMLNKVDIEFPKQEISTYLKVLLSSHDPLQILNTIVGLLHDYCDYSGLKLWIAVVQGVDKFLATGTCLTPLKIYSQDDGGGSLTICHLFICPFVNSFSQKHCSDSSLMDRKSSTEHVGSSQRQVLEEVTMAWKSLYCSVISCTQQELSPLNFLSEDLCLLLSRFLDSELGIGKCATGLNSDDIFQEVSLLSLCGEAVICILDNLQIRKSTSERHDSDWKQEGGISNCFELTARILKIFGTVKKLELLTVSDIISRFLSSLTQLIHKLKLQDDILGFNKVACDALVPWMLDLETAQESVVQSLQQLWTEILACLQRSQPAIIFESSYLQIHATILSHALGHPVSAITAPTLSFWNSTYGNQTSLDVPPCLSAVLDKLSGQGKIKVHGRTNADSQENDSTLKAFGKPCKYKVTATHNKNSKRVGLLEDTDVGHGCRNKPPAAVKRIRRELTEHQKEVRRAQQGRERDCSGHGPGVRTYTGLDFSQGNDYEDSQESQEIRNPELILSLLKRNS